MRKEIDNYEKIEQYLSGKLPPEEMKAFKLLMADDPLLAEEVKQHEQIFDVIIDSTYIDIKEQIKTIHENKKVHYKIRRKRMKIAVGIVTGIIIIGLLTYILFLKKNDEKKAIPSVPIPERHIPSVIAEDTQIKSKIIAPVVTIQPTEPVRMQTEKINPSAKYKSSDEPNQLIKNENVVHDIHEIINSSLPEKESIGENEILPIQDKSFDCSQVNIFANILLEKSCYDHASGAIQIEESSLSGGKPPYEVSIDNQLTYSQYLRFEKLLPTRYSIWIRDMNSCKTWLGSFQIESIDCTIEDKFAPEKGEKWEIPNHDQPYSLKIYNQTGNLVYEEVTNFPGQNTWDGQNQSGHMLPMGVYAFILKLEDGSILSGNITIIR